MRATHTAALRHVQLAERELRFQIGNPTGLGIAMTTIGYVAVVVAIIGFLFGLASAYFWYLSSRVVLRIEWPNIITGSGVAIG
jgi:hypothetical protein